MPVISAGSLPAVSFGRSRCPTHRYSGSSETQATDRSEQLSSQVRRFLRPADTWLTEHTPRMPPSNRSSMPAASSLVMCSRTRSASLATVWPAKVPTSSRGWLRSGTKVCRSARTSTTRRPLTKLTRSSQWEPMSATARSWPWRSATSRQFQSVSDSSQSWW